MFVSNSSFIVGLMLEPSRSPRTVGTQVSWWNNVLLVFKYLLLGEVLNGYFWRVEAIAQFSGPPRERFGCFLWLNVIDCGSYWFVCVLDR